MSMTRKDLHNNIEQTNALHTASISSSTTTTGVIIDTQGYSALEFVLQLGAYTDGTYTPVITAGNAANLSDGVVESNAANIFGTAAAVAAVLVAAHATTRIGYRIGAYRYVRLDIVSTVVTTGATLGATAILGAADQFPTA